jgi:hypothetical protein
MTTPTTTSRDSRNPLRIVLLGLVAFVVFAAFSPAADARIDPLGVPRDNQAPSVEITSPENLSSHVAAHDPESLAFRAVVSMSANATDPGGDPVAIDWYSSVSG